MLLAIAGEIGDRGGTRHRPDFRLGTRFPPKRAHLARIYADRFDDSTSRKMFKVIQGPIQFPLVVRRGLLRLHGRWPSQT